MFSGIIQKISKIQKAERKNGSLFFTINKPVGWKIRKGDSISTNGVCLTVKEITSKTYKTELMPETLNKTSFGKNIPNQVNLELPLRLNDMLNGHLVMGHIDETGKIEKIENNGTSKIYEISFSSKNTKFVVKKGSIAVDGISLTVSSIKKNKFTVSLVDYTLKNTTIEKKKIGDIVNLEFDILGKYINNIHAKK